MDNWWDRVDWSDPIERDFSLNSGLVLWLMGAPNCYGGTRLQDLLNRNHGTLTNIDPAAAWMATARGSSLWLNNTSQSVTFLSPVEIPAGSDVSFAFWMYINGWIGTNPGLIRNGSVSTGSTFCIFNGTSGRPWMRWGGVDAMKPATGYQVPTGEWLRIVFTAKSGGRKRFYANGILRHAANSDTTATPALTGANAFFYCCSQNSRNELPDAYYQQITIHRRELSEADIYEDYLSGLAGFADALRRLRGRSMVSVVDAGGGGATPWLYARRQSQIIGGGMGL